jgi:hypothetical protein
MKKFLKLSAILIAVMSVLFFSCSSGGGGGGGEEPGDDNAVTSIKILIDGAQETPPFKMFIGETVELSAQVLPGKATEKGYDFELLDNNGVLELSENSEELTALKDGTATIKVTSKGKKADGTYATDTLLVSVSDDPSQITAKLVVHNQNETPDEKTTTVLPALNADNRYVIVNNEANATLPSAWTSVAGNTIVYLNRPIKISETETPGTYTPFSISARVRITNGRESGNLNDTANCLVTGMFTKPTDPVASTTPLYFVGFRHAWNGTKRMYASRDSDNSAAAFGSTPAGSVAAPEFEKADTAADKEYGYQEQEYVIKVERTSATVYTISANNADGTKLIASNTRGSSNNQANSKLQSVDDYYYLGFIVSGVTVEISNIVIMDGTEKVFEAATNAVPDTVAVKKVNITTTTPVGADATYNYQCLQANFPSGGLQLSSKVFPTDVSQDVTWSISSGTNGSVTNGLVTITGAGAFTVKAQSAVSASAFGEYKFNILAAAPTPTEVIVEGSSSVTSGNTITLQAVVKPELAVQTVTWSVTAEDGTATTTAATIDASTGVLTANTVSADTVVKVFATSTVNSTKSAAHSVTVKPSGSGPSLPKIWYTPVGNQTSVTTPVTVSGDGKTLTLSGTGSINSSGQVFGFVYLKLPADEDFTMVVKITAATITNSDAARAGIIAIAEKSGTITQNSATGVLTGVPTDTSLPLAGSVYRGNNSWVRIQTTDAAASGTSVIDSTNFPNNTALPEGGAYLRLRRVGNNLFAGVSKDGVTFNDSGSTAPTLGAGYVGLCVSGNGNNVATIDFKDMRFASGTGKGAANLKIDEDLTEIDFTWLK